PEIEEVFWQQVLAFERAPHFTPFKQLMDLGVELPESKELHDHQLSKKLWEVIDRLAEMKMFLERTDHLSDRELYAILYSDMLHRPVALLNDDSARWRYDMNGSGSEEHSYLWLKYYADEEERCRWKNEFPEYELPSHEDPPYNRDHQLPHPQ